MKMKKAVIKITMQYPAGRNWSDYVAISGGQTVKSSVDVLENIELGDVDPPWGQKMREMYTVRKILADAIKASIKDFGKNITVTVQGATAWRDDGSFAFYVNATEKDESLKMVTALMIRAMRILNNLEWILQPGGALLWVSRTSSPTPFTTMSIGDPDIGTKIKDYLTKMYNA